LGPVPKKSSLGDGVGVGGVFALPSTASLVLLGKYLPKRTSSGVMTRSLELSGSIEFPLKGYLI
jgi:hypothetical protein